MVDCAFGFHSIPRSQKIMTSRTRRKLRMRKRTRSEIFRLEAAVREKSVLGGSRFSAVPRAGRTVAAWRTVYAHP